MPELQQTLFQVDKLPEYSEMIFSFGIIFGT